MESVVAKKLKTATSKDVARLAGVSQATVSRVFSRRDYVKDETVAKVMDAAKDLGYTPNAIARGLNNQQTNLIAVVSVNFSNPFYQTLIIRMAEMINAMGKQMLFIQSPFEQELDDILYRVLQYQVDGVVILSAALSGSTSDRFSRVKIPLVVFNKHVDNRYFYSVCANNVEAGAMVAKYLLEKGYDSFGFIAGSNRQTSEHRYRGFAAELAKHGVSNSKISLVSGDYSYRSGARALQQMCQKGAPPRAVFCANDLMAFGAMDMARQKLGLQVPKDIAFVGFDNLEQGQWQSYQLTSVAQPVKEMLEHTQGYFSRQFGQLDGSGGNVLLSTRIVERATT